MIRSDLSFELQSSLMRDVQVGKWGSEVVVSYLFDPDGARKSFRLTFEDCLKVHWELYSLEDLAEAVRDSEVGVIGFSPGLGGHQAPAVITTDTFELLVWYGSLSVAEAR